MKSAVVLATMFLTACGSTISSQQMEQIRIVDSRDCPRMDQIIAQMYSQLDARGLSNRRPEDMTEEQRLYNARAKIIIWNLRAGCNNPGWNL